MTDRYEKIRQALAMRPTPGPWEVINGTDVFTHLGARNAAGVKADAYDGWHIAICDTGPSFTEDGKEELRAREKQANAALIAACDPDTICELLAERDALAAEVERLLAENERLAAEVEVWKASFEQAASGHATYSERTEQLQAENERLAEALRELVAVFSESGMYDEEVFAKARAALAKENSNET